MQSRLKRFNIFNGKNIFKYPELETVDSNQFFLTRELFSPVCPELKTIISELIMSEIIPISKTPTQEKVPFVPPKLDWNENGKN